MLLYKKLLLITFGTTLVLIDSENTVSVETTFTLMLSFRAFNSYKTDADYCNIYDVSKASNFIRTFHRVMYDEMIVKSDETTKYLSDDSGFKIDMCSGLLWNSIKDRRSTSVSSCLFTVL